MKTSELIFFFENFSSLFIIIKHFYTQLHNYYVRTYVRTCIMVVPWDLQTNDSVGEQTDVVVTDNQGRPSFASYF